MKNKNIKLATIVFAAAIHYACFALLSGILFVFMMDRVLDGRTFGLPATIIWVLAAIWELPVSVFLVPLVVSRGFDQAFDYILYVGFSGVSSLFWGWIVVAVVLRERWLKTTRP